MDAPAILEQLEGGTKQGQYIAAQYRDELFKQKVIELYFDFSNNRRRSLQEIADFLNVDRKTVWNVITQINKSDLEGVVPVWSGNIAIQEHVHDNLPGLINRALDIGLGRIPSARPDVQLKAIQWLASLAGVSPEAMQRQTESDKIQNNAIVVSVTVGGTPQPQIIDAEYTEL